MYDLKINTKGKKKIVDITDHINDLLKEKSAQDCVIHLFLTHTTASLTTADLDPGTDLDMLDAFEQMIPKLKFRHPHNPQHTPDHILSSLIGTSLTLLTKKEGLILGTWQRVVLVELDGPRDRTVYVSVTKTHLG